MRELHSRAGQIARILCLLLAALVVYQLAGIVRRWNPFHGVTVPELPSLTAAATNRPSAGTHQTNLVVAAAGKGTNHPPRQPSTNAMPPVDTANTNSTTNFMAALTSAQNGTNLAANSEPAQAGTNTILDGGGRQTAATGQAEPAPPTNTSATTVTNALAKVVAQLELEHGGAHPVPAMLSTNQGTKSVASAVATGTNAAAAKPGRHPANGAPMPEMAGMDFGPGQPPRKHGADLPPAVQAQIHQITESEILAPVMHPLPMGLLGIAGQFAFLRSANGQTGLVKEGDSLDDLKLLRIGVNRVLIEQEGQKKELTIFEGYGGDSLLPKDSTNENNHL